MEHYFDLHEVQRNVPLASRTTIGLGGPADSLVVCDSVQEIQEALDYAEKAGIPVHVLGGGSNTVFSDAGFSGLVIAIHIRGVDIHKKGVGVKVRVGAGENWDALVARTVKEGLAGFECLSGIPGFVGATPIQNVGAYGQEVADTIERVHAVDRNTHKEVSFSNKECMFSYRQSRFKQQDRDRYIITAVDFQLRADGKPSLTYPELVAEVERRSGGGDAAGTQQLETVRDVVLDIRKKKSMVVREEDPHSRSCGSFFTNPILPSEKVEELRRIHGDMPMFPDKQGVKLSAAWLIEHAGFSKSDRRGGIGISPNHILALVNYNGTSAALLEFAREIQAAVKKTFEIDLALEPVVIN